MVFFIGDGPGWWTVVYSAMLSTGAWFLLWLVLEFFTHISEAIAIDTDSASGLRLAGFLVAPGGSMISTVVLSVITNVIDYGFNIQDAVDYPRFHYQGMPNSYKS